MTALVAVKGHKANFFSFFYPFTQPKELLFFFFFYFGEQHVQFIRVTGPAFQCNTAIPQSFCPLFALLCLCNFPPWWPPCFSPLSPVARLLLTGQPLGKTAVDLSCEHTWETCDALSRPWTHSLLTLPKAVTAMHTSFIKVLKMKIKGRLYHMCAYK